MTPNQNQKLTTTTHLDNFDAREQQYRGDFVAIWTQPSGLLFATCTLR
ncbi:hypothetical protein KOR42_18420 [Thalassoglobus neptunius]|uniref:Uncharacterized protein n=1 Tax=Thalassoglobus neptunius TaxID=1938619 RepID=A0A5C5X5T2_9PLAN|nr:hypothetical protein KOR42_18420 [Thalassoglobus neptunius]